MTSRLATERNAAPNGKDTRVHLTETCEAHLSMIVTHVETTSAPITDDAMTTTIYAELARKELLPDEHIVDTGYVDAQLLVESQRDSHIELIGPARKNAHRQVTEHTGYDVDHFPIDWEKQQATYPQGHPSVSWLPAVDNRKNEVIKITFSTTDCRAGQARSLCTPTTSPPRRTLTIRRHAHYLALKQRREQQKTEGFAQVYSKRAGIEGTISESAFGSWVCGVPVTSDRRKRISSMLPRQPLLTSFVVWYG